MGLTSLTSLELRSTFQQWVRVVSCVLLVQHCPLTFLSLYVYFFSDKQWRTDRQTAVIIVHYLPTYPQQAQY